MPDNMRIKRMPAHEQVFERLKDAIKNKQWETGEKIPSEIELSEKFGVNRLTVRMALQKLIGMGLLETRIGDGTYVKEFCFQSYVERASDFYMKPELLDKVCEFRKVVELACAKLAIDNADEEELATLSALCDEYDQLKQEIAQNYSEESFRDLVSKDLEFHRQVCLMAHNELFLYAFDVAKEPIYQYLMVIINKRIEGWMKKHLMAVEWNDLHKDIYRAILTKNFDALKKAYLDMVDRQIDL